MTPDTVLTIGRGALEVVVLLAAPLLIMALLVGLFIGVFQAATQINEMTLSFIPKLVAVALAIMVAGPWMLSLLVNYTQRLYSSIPGLVG